MSPVTNKSGNNTENTAKRHSPWDYSKSHKVGKYTVYSISARKDAPVKWYTEVHMDSRHGLLYRESFGSKMPTRKLAVWASLFKYLLGVRNG